MLIVYLSNRYIRAVSGTCSGSGRIKIQRLYEIEDSGNCILNGTVTDENAFVDMMRSFWKNNKLPVKDVYLVLDSNQFNTKITEVPQQKTTKMLEYVSREFSDVERIVDPIYGYFELSEGKERSGKLKNVFAMAVPRSYVVKFQELFSKIGVTLTGIESVMGVLRRLNGISGQLKKANGIVQFIDDITIINCLLVEGEYVYTSRNRLFSEPGTPGYVVEAARAVSNILQFSRSQGIVEDICKVYVSGLSEEELEIYTDSISQIDSILEAEELSLRTDVKMCQNADALAQVPGMILAIAALRITDPRTGIIRQTYRDPKKEAQARKRWRLLMLFGGVLLVFTGVSGALWYKYSSLRTTLDEIENYNSNPSVIQACQDYELNNQELEKLTELVKGINGLQKVLQGYPRVNSLTELVVEHCANGLVDAEISSYNSQTGVLSFDTSADSVEKIHQFAELLEAQSIFSSVDYTGYTQDKNQVWHVKINGTMAAEKESEDETDNN